MDIAQLLKDKNTRSKEKADILSKWILEKKISIEELIHQAAVSEKTKATCMEALAYATKHQPEMATETCFSFATDNLSSKLPRVKWESAKVITNIAFLFQNKLDDAISGLLLNSEHSGTVVRWSAALALVEIVKFHTVRNADLVPAMETLYLRENKDSIKKLYLQAIKEAKSGGLNE